MTINQLREMWNSLGIAILLLISSGWSDAKSELDNLTGGMFSTLRSGYPGYNKNGNKVEIFMAKWAPDYKSVAGWAGITEKNEPDQHPSALVGVEDTTKTPVRAIKITSDLRDKVFAVGDSLSIKWDATEVPSIMIQASINGDWVTPMLTGDNESGIRPDMDNWGDFIWIVPDTLPFGESLLDQNVRLVVADYWDPELADTTASFKVVKNSNIQLPSLSDRIWSVLLDGRGGHKLYINKAGSYTVRILNVEGAVHREFTCPGRTWHTLEMRQGPGVYLIRIGSGSEKSIQRLFVIQ